jgi:hypothetical protein
MLVKTKFPNHAPLRIKAEAIKYLSSLPQFHGISDQNLIGLAHRRTKLNVPERWVAIALILGNRIPIPVAGQGRPSWQPRQATPPAKLKLIQGRRVIG